MNGPRVMCSACGVVEVGIFSPFCGECCHALQDRPLPSAPDSLPWLDPDENVHPDDKPLPTEGGLFDEIPAPRDPYARPTQSAKTTRNDRDR